MWLLYAFLSAIAASFVAIFAKLGLKNIDSSIATFLRAGIMFIFLFGFVILSGKISNINLKEITGRDWILIALSGIAGAISWIFYFYALKIADDNSTSKVVGIDKLSMVFVAIFAILILKEKLEWNTLAGVGLMSLGAIILTLKL